jgi:hypothetical protein
MADNFNMKKFLVENKLGAYSKLKTEGEAAYEYEKGKAAGEKEEKEKLAKEDLESDLRGDLEKVSGLGPILDPSKLNALVKRLATMAQNRDYIRDDRMEFARVAKMLMNNKLADAAKYIIQLETSPRETVYEEISNIYPELWDMLYDNPKGEYIALAKPKKGLPEDLDQDRTDAEAEKMMDFLAEKEKEKLKEIDEPIMQLINDPEVLKTFLMSAAKLGGIGVGIAGLLKAYVKYIASKLKKDPKYADKSGQELEKMAGQALTGKVQASAGGSGGGFLAEDDSQIDEALSSEAIDRMEGEANEQALRNLQSSLLILVPDWLEEGMFDEDDVVDYLTYLIKQSL